MKKTALSLRQIRPSDYKSISELLASCDLLYRTRNTWFTRARYLSMLRRNKGLYWAALIDDRLVGCVFACDDGGHLGYIYKLAVDVRYRQRGIAKRLLNKVMKELKRRKVVWYFAFAKKKNLPSARLFKSFGFGIINNTYNTFSL